MILYNLVIKKDIRKLLFVIFLLFINRTWIKQKRKDIKVVSSYADLRAMGFWQKGNTILTMK